MAAKPAGSSEAPPTSAPSTSGCAKYASVIPGATLNIGTLLRRPAEPGAADVRWHVEHRRVEGLQDAIFPPRGKEIAG